MAAVLLALPVHLLAAVLTGGFGVAWGSAAALYDVRPPRASPNERSPCASRPIPAWSM